MDRQSIEAGYPITFRSQDAKILGEHLKNRHSVSLIGMKRVGISNFLRFFLYHKAIPETYIRDQKKHLFIPIDLNDLIEREIFPFWTLTLKRIADAVVASDLPPETKKHIESLFVESIQAHNLFLTIDNVRQSLVTIGENDMLPTLFYLRFDRMKDAATPEFLANLQGLKDATHQKLSYIFTSYRRLDKLAPVAFPKASLSVFLHTMYIKPALKEDSRAVYDIYKKKYELAVTPAVEKGLFEIVDGYIRYLQLALIFLHEQKKPIPTKEALFSLFLTDERITLQGEELWESLDEDEQHVLKKICQGKEITDVEKEKTKYLFDTGFLKEEKKTLSVFSPLFSAYITGKNERMTENSPLDFTKKEHLLFNTLKDKKSEICEREDIITEVWPEVEDLGVSDWAIDRLVARVRKKMKLQKSPYSIQTVKTRGYRLLLS